MIGVVSSRLPEDVEGSVAMGEDALTKGGNGEEENDDDDREEGEREADYQADELTHVETYEGGEKII